MPLARPLRLPKGITTAAFSPDSQTIWTGSSDGSGRCWRSATGEPQGEPIRHSTRVAFITLSPDGKTVLTGSGETAILWDAQSGAKIRSFSNHPGGMSSVAFSPDGKTILTGSHDQTADPRDTVVKHVSQRFENGLHVDR